MWLSRNLNLKVLLDDTEELTFFFFNFGEIMTYSFMKTNCPHEVVQTKVWEKWHESENALKYPISLLLPQRGGEIKED